MRYLVKLDELKQKIDYLEKQLSIIDENISVLKNVKSSIIWEGKASTAFNNHYDNYIGELTSIEEKILSSISYLYKFYDRYGSEFNDMRQKFVNLANNERAEYGDDYL